MEKKFVQNLHNTLKNKGVKLIAVSKTKPVSAILELYELGIRDFGENKPQELVEKYEVLPKDIRWHMIGNLQRNKVKYIAPFIHLIHSVSSESLLKTIDKEALKNSRRIKVLLQIKIATEQTKFGLEYSEAQSLLRKLEEGEFSHIQLRGFMGMASFTDNEQQIRREFNSLTSFIEQSKVDMKDSDMLNNADILSMGMSGDYKQAIESGSNMVRIGSLLFGSRV